MSGVLSCQPMCLVGEEASFLFSCSRRKFTIDHETSMGVLEKTASWVDQPVVLTHLTAPLVDTEDNILQVAPGLATFAAAPSETPCVFIPVDYNINPLVTSTTAETTSPPL